MTADAPGLLTRHQRERLDTLVARALHPYVCGRTDPEVPTCLRDARKVTDEWLAEWTQKVPDPEALPIEMRLGLGPR